jgi:hypothetical protein
MARLARALAGGGTALEGMARGVPIERLQLFVEGNAQSRRQKLEAQLAFVAPAFSDFKALVARYARETALSAYDTGAADGARFLDWVGRTRQPTDVQRDFLACQQARFTVEAAARANRSGYLRFQELWSTAEFLSRELATNPALQVLLNPIRVWARCQTEALLRGAARPPADVLFYALRGGVRAAVLERDARRRLLELESAGPVTINGWLEARRAGNLRRIELVRFCRHLARLGLAAFA